MDRCLDMNVSKKGRYRQFNQFGVEAIGAENPSVDAEVLAMVMHIYQSFGLKHLKLVINSVGIWRLEKNITKR